MLGACAPVRCKNVGTWAFDHPKNGVSAIGETRFSATPYIHEQQLAGKRGCVAVMKAVIKERKKQ